MIDILICDDNNIMLENICDNAYNVLKNKVFNYQIIPFHDYNNKFLDLLNAKDITRIYILDIETPSASGIDIIRKIRDSDNQSVIIVITAHEEYSYEIVTAEFNILVFISKKDKTFDKKLKSAIEKAIVIVQERVQVYSFKSDDCTYNIPLKDILYISTVKNERSVQLITEYSIFKVKETLTNVVAKLNKNFIQTFISCYVNVNKIVKVDYKNNIIYFANNIKIPFLSRTYKKKLKEAMKNRNTK